MMQGLTSGGINTGHSVNIFCCKFVPEVSGGMKFVPEGMILWYLVLEMPTSELFVCLNQVEEFLEESEKDNDCEKESD
jgi:hypothetical protein